MRLCFVKSKPHEEAADSPLYRSYYKPLKKEEHMQQGG